MISLTSHKQLIRWNIHRLIDLNTRCLSENKCRPAYWISLILRFRRRSSNSLDVNASRVGLLNLVTIYIRIGLGLSQENSRTRALSIDFYCATLCWQGICCGPVSVCPSVCLYVTTRMSHDLQWSSRSFTYFKPFQIETAWDNKWNFSYAVR